MKAIKTAIFGTGFMGRVHLEAVRRVESVEAAAVVGRNAQAVERLAAGFQPCDSDRERVRRQVGGKAIREAHGNPIAAIVEIKDLRI